MLYKLHKLIQKWIEKKYVGSLTINFFKGGISNVVEKRSIKLEELKSS